MIMKRLVAALLLGVVLSGVAVVAQNVPSISCPQYFEYLSFQHQFIGHISVPLDANNEQNIIYVEFSQRTPVVSNFVGQLSLYSDEETTKYNLRNGLPVEYRVDFPNAFELPKLTLLSINNLPICSSVAYPPPNTIIKLTHTLHSSVVPLLFAQHHLQPVTTQRPRVIQVPQQQQQRQFAPIQRRPQTQMQQEPYYIIDQDPAPAPATAPALVPTVQAPELVPARSSQTIFGTAELNRICGREITTTSPLIFHGTAVARGKLPWMAAIFQKQRDGLSFFCGGTLVSRSTVVSAAHCFRVNRILPANRTVVSLGRSNLDDYTSGVLRDIEVVLVHQQYKAEDFSDADIALLKLVEPVTFDNYIKPICLWNENFRLELPTGYKSYVAGWGADQDGNSNSKIAKMTDIDILSESECKQNLRSFATNLVTPRTICAANKEGAGPCTGDSGGGLMLNENNVWVLRGIVSAGQLLANRCDLTQPVIFCDLAKHIEWLRQSMWF